MSQMADVCGVSQSYLSAVELGKKHPSRSIVSAIDNRYELTREQFLALEHAALMSQRRIYFELAIASDAEKAFLSKLLLLFGNIPNDVAQKMEAVLEKAPI